jgi:hypothetical protein
VLDIGTAKFDRRDHSSNHQDNHLDNISGIRTRAIEIVNVIEIDFGWLQDRKKTVLFYFIMILIHLISWSLPEVVA